MSRSRLIIGITVLAILFFLALVWGRETLAPEVSDVSPEATIQATPVGQKPQSESMPTLQPHDAAPKTDQAVTRTRYSFDPSSRTIPEFDYPGAKDHPIVPRYPAAMIVAYQETNGEEYCEYFPAGSSLGDGSCPADRIVDRKIIYLARSSPDEIQDFYRETLSTDGWQNLYRSQDVSRLSSEDTMTLNQTEKEMQGNLALYGSEELGLVAWVSTEGSDLYESMSAENRSTLIILHVIELSP